MGLLDKLKKKPKETLISEFKLEGTVYFEEYFWKLLNNQERATYPAFIVPNPSGYSKYMVKINNKPIGYFPHTEEQFFDMYGKYIVGVQVEIYTDKMQRGLGVIRIAYTK